ncbi:10117_t:CDS:1, partial [Racocetra persica]
MRRSAIFFVLGLLALTTLTSAEIYLKETFSDDDWEKKRKAEEEKLWEETREQR